MKKQPIQLSCSSLITDLYLQKELALYAPIPHPFICSVVSAISLLTCANATVVLVRLADALPLEVVAENNGEPYEQDVLQK